MQNEFSIHTQAVSLCHLSTAEFTQYTCQLVYEYSQVNDASSITDFALLYTAPVMNLLNLNVNLDSCEILVMSDPKQMYLSVISKLIS